MKKFLSMMFVIASIVCFSSCSEDDGEMNPYAGTKWSRTTTGWVSGDKYVYVIEFTDTDFCYYEADAYGNYKSGMTQGKYTYSGNKITINSIKDKTSMLDDYITGATISGNSLTLHFYRVYSNGEHSSFNQTMGKIN